MLLTDWLTDCVYLMYFVYLLLLLLLLCTLPPFLPWTIFQFCYSLFYCSHTSILLAALNQTIHIIVLNQRWIKYDLPPPQHNNIKVILKAIIIINIHQTWLLSVVVDVAVCNMSSFFCFKSELNRRDVTSCTLYANAQFNFNIFLNSMRIHCSSFIAYRNVFYAMA